MNARRGLTQPSGTRDVAAQYASPENFARRLTLYQYLARDPAESSFAEWVLSHANIGATDVIADIGCGLGMYAEALAGRAHAYIGGDRSWAMTREAQRRGALGLVLDAEQLPLRNGSVDLVLAAHVLHHVDPAVLSDRVVPELARVLKPHGSLLVVANGLEDKREIRDIWTQASSHVLGCPIRPVHWATNFSLESADAVLGVEFADIEIFPSHDHFEVPRAEPVVDRLASFRSEMTDVDDSTWSAILARATHLVSEHITTNGAFLVTRRVGVVRAILPA